MAGMTEHQRRVLSPGSFEGVEDIGVFRDMDMEFLPVRAGRFVLFGPGCPPDLKDQWLFHGHIPNRYETRGVVRVWQGVLIPIWAQTISHILSAMKRAVVVLPPMMEKKPGTPSFV